MSQTQAQPQVSGSMYLFEKPELLNKDRHEKLGITPPKQLFKFCAAARVSPVTMREIPLVIKHYPIVFASQDNPVPLAVLGLIDDVNLFVDDNGQWEPNTYVPGYLRRYPFAVAGESGGERFAVVVDTGFEGVVEGAENPFFDKGEPTRSTQQAIEFCKAYEAERVLTEELSKRIKALDLITGQGAQYTPAGKTEPITFAQYFCVDEKKLSELDDSTFLDLRKSNLLPILYAMLMSQGNWRHLLTRRAARFNLTEDQIVKQVTAAQAQTT